MNSISHSQLQNINELRKKIFLLATKVVATRDNSFTHFLSSFEGSKEQVERAVEGACTNKEAKSRTLEILNDESIQECTEGEINLVVDVFLLLQKWERERK